MIRTGVRYTGRVQGVGFRWTAKHTADGFDVSGWVMNRPDGSVELVVEGEKAEVKAFLAALAERMAGNIVEAIENRAPATGEFTGFEIRY